MYVKGRVNEIIIARFITSLCCEMYGCMLSLAITISIVSIQSHLYNFVNFLTDFVRYSKSDFNSDLQTVIWCTL